MTKIAFIGAGSLGFTRGLVRDILTFPLLQDATLCLMDVDKERLEFSRQAVEILVRRSKTAAKVVATTSRKEALEGADAVLCTILAGSVQVWRHDIEIPMKFGVDTNIGDTRGPSGIFRALRTIPVMLSICRDMERYCPKALLLNYTNPMAMLCRAMQRESKIQVSGLCHSVQGTAGMLASWVGAKMEDVTYVCAGLNHLAWYIKFQVKGKDAYPKLRKVITTNKEIYMKEIVRNEMFLHLDYYVTESSGHNSEYNAWFRKRPDLIKKYCLPGTGWNPGVYGYILKEYLRREKGWKKDIKKMLQQTEDMTLDRGHEYASRIINAYMGGETFEFNGNVANTGLVPNLPMNACVEVPVIANKRGINPLYVGPLPASAAALTNLTAAVEEMAVEAAITGNPRLVMQAIMHDPLSMAVCSMAEIQKMTQAMLDKNKAYLPQFKSVKI
jgi:alpha-galactosidase